MKFRPCIDLHHGQVKQIVGSTLTIETDGSNATDRRSNNSQQEQELDTNFATDRPASDYAQMYQTDHLTGGHVIMLGPGNKEAAKSALQAYPNGLQVGGGITNVNAQEWLDYGASHIIVTSYLFDKEGNLQWDRLKTLVQICGKERLVVDLSCRQKPNDEKDKNYYVVTNKWQTFSNVAVTPHTLQELALHCDEFLVHGVDVEGKQCGILDDLVALLGEYSPIPVTYAGGVRSIADLEVIQRVGKNKVDATVGSALDCFGGSLPYKDVVTWHAKQNE